MESLIKPLKSELYYDEKTEWQKCSSHGWITRKVGK
jgi:hypothetical protein